MLDDSNCYANRENRVKWIGSASGEQHCES